MVEVKNIEVFNLDRAIKAINNSFNVGEINTLDKPNEKLQITAKSLGSNMNPHESHDAFLKGVLVTFDIKLNLVLQKELQRYHFLELIMQQSSMHSMEKFMTSDVDPFTKYVSLDIKNLIRKYYSNWNLNKMYLKSYTEEHKNELDKEEIKNKINKLKADVYVSFETLVHNLPCGFELWATITTNYLQLKTIVIQRKNHKNVEDWHSIIAACYSMPRFRELCGFEGKEWDLNNLFPLIKELI